MAQLILLISPENFDSFYHLLAHHQSDIGLSGWHSESKVRLWTPSCYSVGYNNALNNLPHGNGQWSAAFWAILVVWVVWKQRRRRHVLNLQCQLPTFKTNNLCALRPVYASPLQPRQRV